ncbi:MAG: L-rhamnose isomerase [Candidatus Bathyarchaeota archaeon]
MNTTEAYQQAKQKYAEQDVDTDRALKTLQQKPISIHCWQTDDVTGLEKNTTKGGGILATGNQPGRARNIQEIWTDLKKLLSLTPGTKRINIHAMYGNYTVDRDQIKPEHFQDWINWAQTHNVKLDFNPTLFAHPKADTGFTLSSKDPAIREFWITHVKRCREIADHIGREQGSPCMHNLWIPDGMKDITIDRMGYRTHLRESLDTIYAEKHSHIKDSLESKLFGIASETYVVGSHDFYQAYTLTHGLIPCLDTGHYHPTESVADKITSTLQYAPEILLHISRGVRWDSDHIPIQDTQTQDIFHELVRSNTLNRAHIALDYFDASINRIGAYHIGIRATQKALLYALLEPTQTLREHEEADEYYQRLALLEEQKTMPIGAVWDHYCTQNNAPTGTQLIKEIQQYEKQVLSKRR